MLTVQESAASKQPVKLARVLKVRSLEIDRLVDSEWTKERDLGGRRVGRLDRDTTGGNGRQHDRWKGRPGDEDDSARSGNAKDTGGVGIERLRSSSARELEEAVTWECDHGRGDGQPFAALARRRATRSAARCCAFLLAVSVSPSTACFVNVESASNLRNLPSKLAVPCASLPISDHRIHVRQPLSAGRMLSRSMLTHRSSAAPAPVVVSPRSVSSSWTTPRVRSSVTSRAPSVSTTSSPSSSPSVRLGEYNCRLQR